MDLFRPGDPCPRRDDGFTSAFKSEAVRLLTEGDKPLQQVAAELGVHANQLRMWRNEHLAAGSAEALARQKAEASVVHGSVGWLVMRRWVA